MDTLLEFATGPCKLRRRGAPTCVIVERDPKRGVYHHVSGDALTELPLEDVATDPSNTLRQYQRRNGDHVFSAFSLEADGTGKAWQLRYIPLAPPGKSLDGVAQVHSDLVVGELENEDGRAGLVSRLLGDHTPTPSSQVVLRRDPQCRSKCDVVIVNGRGVLSADSQGRYFFSSNGRGSPIRFERILSMIDMGATEPLDFVRHPQRRDILVLPPLDESADDFEQRHFHPVPLRQVHAPPLEDKRRREDSAPATSILHRPSPPGPPPEYLRIRRAIEQQSSPVEALYVLLVAAVVVLSVMVALPHRQETNRASVFTTML